MQKEGKSEVIYDNSHELGKILDYYYKNTPNENEASLLEEIRQCYCKEIVPKQQEKQGINGLDNLVNQILKCHSHIIQKQK